MQAFKNILFLSSGKVFYKNYIEKINKNNTRYTKWYPWYMNNKYYLTRKRKYEIGYKVLNKKTYKIT